MMREHDAEERTPEHRGRRREGATAGTHPPGDGGGLRDLAGRIGNRGMGRLLRRAAEGGWELDEDTAAEIETRRGHGRPLDAEHRATMEQTFGRDLSDVQIHTDATADDLNRRVHAEAFTVGRDVFFRAGRYAPDTVDGRRLLAHELTHVLQQRHATGPPRAVSDPDDTAEREAEAVSGAALALEAGSRTAGNQRLTTLLRTGMPRSPRVQRWDGSGQRGLQTPRFRMNRRLRAAWANRPPLKAGERGRAVELVQEALVEAGYEMPDSISDGTPDGIFGPETYRTVRAFQRERGLTVDGQVGHETIGALDADVSTTTGIQAGPAGGPPGEGTIEFHHRRPVLRIYWDPTKENERQFKRRAFRTYIRSVFPLFPDVVADNYIGRMHLVERSAPPIGYFFNNVTIEWESLRKITQDYTEIYGEPPPYAMGASATEVTLDPSLNEPIESLANTFRSLPPVAFKTKKEASSMLDVAHSAASGPSGVAGAPGVGGAGVAAVGIFTGGAMVADKLMAGKHRDAAEETAKLLTNVLGAAASAEAARVAKVAARMTRLGSILGRVCPLISLAFFMYDLWDEALKLAEEVDTVRQKNYYVPDVSGLMASWVFNDPSTNLHSYLLGRAERMYSPRRASRIRGALNRSLGNAIRAWNVMSNHPGAVAYLVSQYEGDSHRFWIALAEEIVKDDEHEDQVMAIVRSYAK